MGSLSHGWLDGTLVSASALHVALVECALGPQEDALGRAVRRCRPVLRRASLQLGPACGSSAVWRILAGPLTGILGWRDTDAARESIGALSVQVVRLQGPDARPGPRQVLLVALPWGVLPGPVTRAVCRRALDEGIRWAMVTNGQVWRWLDGHRPLGRQYVEIQLAAAHADERVWEALWVMGHAANDRLDGLERLTRSMEAGATQAVRQAVAGVRSELTHQLRATDEEVLTHVFRWLFLLFAEARGLLPMHNPVYRQAYAISSLAQYARLGTPPFNLWDGLRASARLAHAGSLHPLLTVTALNGALFEPSATPRAARQHLPDAKVGPMLDALTTVTRGGRRTRVSFADLGVEHLGTIYEDVLAGSPDMVRKQTGTFYTPRDLADTLVADTLAPLVTGRSADEILALRVLDPAAGSGAILASAARYLLGALEAAWVREGRGGPLDVPADERSGAIRRIVEQCLYGVDLHGRAIQVARLSLWLVSMTRERPLTFLDHHLRQGNSLIGTTPADIVARRPGARGMPGFHRRQGPSAQLALFDLEAWDRQAGMLALALTRLTSGPSDTAGDVHGKTRRFRALQEDAALRRWKRRADLWCGAWMHAGHIPDGLWSDLDRFAGDEPTSAPREALAPLAGKLEAIARDVGCFHWPLEFPEVFHARTDPGFDAVIANPPWEMLRADLGTSADRAASRTSMMQAQRFLSRCGSYSAATTGHRNLYQLFVERMLQMCRQGGRLGVVAPWGLLTEHASAATRRALFASASVDAVTVFDNRRRIFPIHRSVRFVGVTATKGSPTTGLTLRATVTSLEGRKGSGLDVPSLRLDAGLLRRADPEGLALPCLRSALEVRALEAILARGTRLGEPPWSLRFGRELNATDDRALLRDEPPGPGRLPVIGGRHLRPFAAVVPVGGPSLSQSDAASRLPHAAWRRWRLAYRDVASATNRLSLIAAPLPPGVLSTHTVFVTRRPPGGRRLLYLSGVLNSFVANWFVRLYMGTHVTSALLARLPVPVPGTAPELARRIARLAGRLRRCDGEGIDARAEYAELQVAVARLYGLQPEVFAAIAESFPLIAADVRAHVTRALARASAAAAHGDPDRHREHAEDADGGQREEPLAGTHELSAREDDASGGCAHQHEQARVQQVGRRLARHDDREQEPQAEQDGAQPDADTE